MVRFVARYDGKHLLPDEAVNLPTDTPLRVTVEAIAEGGEAGPLNVGEWFDRLETEVGLADGPQDWAAELDHYLSGAPRTTVNGGG